MKRYSLIPALLSLGFVVVGCSSLSDTIPNVDRSNLAASSDADEVLERIAVIRELVYLGTKDKDALALVAAARLTRRLPTFEGREPTKLVPAPTKKLVMSEVYNDSVDGMIKRARGFAGSDRRILVVIDQVAALPKTKPGGTAYLHGLGRKSTDQYEVFHKAGTRAVIYIEAQEEDQYLKLSVIDDRGNVVCQGDRRRAQTRCAWTPLRDGKFRFSVENPLDEDLHYVLFTN